VEHPRFHESQGSVPQAERVTVPDRLHIVTDEASPFYYRIRLPEFISGDADESALLARNEQWYDDRRMDLKLRTAIVSADPGEQTLLTREGVTFHYDRLLVATGGVPFVPRVKGADRRGVFVLRTLLDAREISVCSVDAEEVAIVGGGLLGIEAGYALRKRGKRVTLVERAERLLHRQLDHKGCWQVGAFERMSNTGGNHAEVQFC